jgi:hypothetical protein
MSVNLKNASLNTHLPVLELEKLQVVAVDRFLLEDAKGSSPMGEMARRRVEALLPGSREEWALIGSSFEDQTYFSEEEGKWEFCSADDLLFVRKADLERATRAWEKELSRPLTHNPFAALLAG